MEDDVDVLGREQVVQSGKIEEIELLEAEGWILHGLVEVLAPAEDEIVDTDDPVARQE